jgi:polysaccharide export outer membrane protein
MYKNIFFLLAFILVLMSSCGSYKKLTYVRNLAEKERDTTDIKNKPQYKLQTADILYVRVLTPNEQVNALFNPMFSSTTSANAFREESLYLMGYEINDSGYIDLPVMGKLHVAGMTMDSVRNHISNEADKYLKEAQIIVKLANLRFTVLGEVKAPGMKTANDYEISILEALSYAGDVTYNGNRQNILVIRPTDKGNISFRIDVTNKDLVNTKEYFVMPNDIIYVEPLRATLFRERTQDYLVGVTAIGTVLSTIALIISISSK